ncbi:MAG: hypothetical protein QXW70_00885 [Candidatus Anstonellales archaeon]
MPTIKKSFRCSCGAYISLDFSSDMNIDELTASGTCRSCGNVLHISVVSMQGGERKEVGSDFEKSSEEEKKDVYESGQDSGYKISSDSINRALDEMFGY